MGHSKLADLSNQSKDDEEPLLIAQMRVAMDGEHDRTANLANAAAVLFMELSDVNWAGFYLLTDGELVLGPFQGKPATSRIAMGKGVCGTAASTRQTVRVDNVHAFDGHIACDIETNAEIVVPLIKGDQLLGVMDIDSPLLERFSVADQQVLEAIARFLVTVC